MWQMQVKGKSIWKLAVAKVGRIIISCFQCTATNAIMVECIETCDSNENKNY